MNAHTETTYPEYYSALFLHGAWTLTMFGRPVWDGDRRLTYTTAGEARAEADRRNRRLRPTLGAQCPMCASTKTYSDDDGWLNCLNCGSRNK